MRYKFQPSFNRDFKKELPYKQELIRNTIEKLKVFYETGQLLPGLGLKNLRKNYWEIRASLYDRILFVFDGDVLSFILVGNHDDIRRYLKNL